MTFFTTLDVSSSERAFLVVNGVPTTYLAAGRHRVWSLRKKIDVKRCALDALVFDLAPEFRALIPAGEALEIVVDDNERAVVMKRGRPFRVLDTGTYFVWNHDGVVVDTVRASGVDTEPLRRELARVLTGHGYIETHVTDGGIGVRFVDGKIDALLPPGKHAAWSLEHDVKFVTIDMRERILAVSGQDVMSKDKVTIRLNASVSFRIVDVKTFISTNKDVEQALYLLVQLALRDLVGAHPLDALLSERDILSTQIFAAVKDDATKMGIEIARVGVKDVILPGEMKTILNRVIEAQKAAEANVISRREEAAATRSLAQTAKVLEENPTLMRLKELEAYGELAAKVGNVHVVFGGDSLGKIELKSV